jgi:immune inhibitor A
MHFRILLISLLAVSFGINALAVPARPGSIKLTQPNGITFNAKVRGDEFFKIFTDENGHALTTDKDGYYCYAYYTSDGAKKNSGVRVGAKASSSVLSASSIIPYSQLSEFAKAKRSEVAAVESLKPNIMKRLQSMYMMSPSSTDSKATATVVKKHCIIILAQFTDLKFTFTKQNFIDMATKTGYSYNGATGSIVEYFNDQFKGSYNFTFEVSDIVTLSNGYAYYGKNDSKGSDSHPAELVAEACRLATNVDFSQFDDDNDGSVDNVFVIVPGGDEAAGAGDDHIWSHQWYLSEAGINLTLNGKKIDNYAISTELSGSHLTPIGTFCHEYSHTLGLADMYDTDYEGSGGEDNALGNTSIMDSGPYNNNGNTPPYYGAIDRDMLGIGSPTTLSAGSFTLEPVNLNGKYFIMQTGVSGEYYLFECRSNTGWDKYVGGKGMLIYHIDKSNGNTGWSDTYSKNMTAKERWEYNEVNCRPDHQCADLIEAVTNAKVASQMFFPYGSSHTSYTPSTTPAFKFWNGNKSIYSITNIAISGDNVTFSASTQADEPPKVTFDRSEIYQDAVIMLWEADRIEYKDKAYVTYGTTDGKQTSLEVSPYADSKYALTLEGLTPGKSYSATINFKLGDVVGESFKTSFTTSSYSSGSYPYIFFNSRIARNTDGSFPSGTLLPLRVRNAVGAKSIVWYLGSNVIKTEANGYYTLVRSGDLKAVITYPDGSIDEISKTITVK